MRLSSGHIFPIPVTLPVDAGTEIHLDRDVALRDLNNELLAVMTVEEIYAWDLSATAQKVLGTVDARHPLVAEMNRWGRLNISGRLRVLSRSLMGSERFIEVFVNTPLEVCRQRDTKGMYAKALRGELKGFTGVNDPYEPPLKPEIEIDTVAHAAEMNARTILSHLIERGFVRDGAGERV